MHHTTTLDSFRMKDSLYWPYYKDEHAVARFITESLYGPGNDLCNAERTFRTSDDILRNAFFCFSNARHGIALPKK